MQGIKKLRITRTVEEEVEVVVNFENHDGQDPALWEELFCRALEKGKKTASHDSYAAVKQYGYVHPLSAEIDFTVINGRVSSES
jgi:hypothetical protein